MCKRQDQKTNLRTWNVQTKRLVVVHGMRKADRSIYAIYMRSLNLSSIYLFMSINCMPSFYIVLYMRIYIFFVKNIVQNALPER